MTFVALIVTSCTQNGGTQKFANPTQQSFDNLLVKYTDGYFSGGNDIQQKEIEKKFDAKLCNLLDSVKLFTEFKGRIKDIKLSDERLNGNQYKVLKFTLYYIPAEKREVTFDCYRVYEVDKLEESLLYKQIKSISDYSDVYFDGLIKRTPSNGIQYGSFCSNKAVYPTYDFYPLYVSKTPRSNGLSNDLKALIDMDSEITKVFHQELNGSVSDGAFKDIVASKKDSVQMFLNRLTKDESEYRNDLFNYWVSEK